MDAALLIARLVLAGVFAVAGAAKLADLAGSRAAVEGFGVPARLAAPIGFLLPFAELTTAGLLLFGSTARAGALAALALLLLFSIGIAASIARGEAPDCHCFGQLHSEPAGPRTLVRNLVLAAVAAFAAFAGDTPGSGVEDIGDLSGTAAVAVGLGLAILGLAGLGAILALSLLRQNGQLMLRIDALEAALRSRGIVVPQTAPAPDPAGLPVGTEAPEFELPALSGDTITLAARREPGKPVVLLFTDPACGPCRKLMPRVAEWREEHAGKLTFAPISRGTEEATERELGANGGAPVLVERRLDVSNRYEARATPSAVLVDAAGRVASPLAAGDTAIVALVERTLNPPVTVQPAGRPPAPKPGTELPTEVGMASLDGEEMTLADALGARERTVLFWDPNCGFCKRMLPDLLEFEAHHPDRAEDLLLISTGDPEVIRAQGIAAEVVLDQGHSIGRSIGYRGTPSGMKVGADGAVASDYAVGADAVLSLARG